MFPRFCSVALTVALVLVVACGSEGGSNLPSAAGDCPQTGVRACGDLETGSKAVLVCSKSNKWEVEVECAGECVLVQRGPACAGVTQDVEPVPDVTEMVTGDGPVDVGEDEGGPPEPEVIEEIGEVVFKDLMPDFTPPWVESTSPTDGEMNVPVPSGEEKMTIKVVFTEPVYEPTIASSTIDVTTAGGKSLPLTFGFEDDEHTTVLITIDGAVFASSPYTVELHPDIRDLAGNPMGNTFKFSFYTAPIPTLNHYYQIAGKYAPLIYGETFVDAPQYDYFTRFDLDGNWIAFDNVDYIKASAQKVEPHVYFSVTETKSHYFVFYAFYYPLRYTETESARFGNDVSGSMVVVRKSDSAPIAVETWFKMQEWDERSISYITTDSGLVPEGQTFSSMKFDGMLENQTLFPNGHYVAWLSARDHESCLWLDENNSYLDGCQLNAGIKASMTYVEYKYKGGEVTTINKVGGKFPATASDIGYGLSHLLESWWPRRSDIGPDKMWDNTYEYEPHTTGFPNRPQFNDPLPSLFVDPIGNDNGRPPWAWRHYPQNGASFYDMPRGVMFMDPAVHFQQRHDQAYPHQWAGFDGQTGYSTEYCFNPYFNLDFRGIWPECSSAQ